MNFLEKFINKNTTKYIDAHNIITSPGSTIPFDEYSGDPGEYTITFHIENLSSADDISFAVLLKQNPDSDHKLYASIPVPMSKASLWKVELPPSFGIIVKVNQRSGRELRSKIAVFRKEIIE